ncbi:TetR/AcrR family transcriptional regulator [Gramella sp. GC03-9]|uniref:TetR/AcrR family transcriptional regulator n=1 Tax=Christiangramia oceanisediminis TaxID=2920386 RepID=A0A9X2KUZ6_9FLAO|nr:TetR/AcrR family transcriptional regulator [Gramella oceanisediminis]MCP9198672.1 TetR/AcrR family transcriptional regulator [Gramella oceanisediminis]
MNEKYIGTGRKNQKLKTRDKILESTQSLMENSENLTLEDVAKKAGISRATIYRYYSKIEILVAEAVLDLNTKSTEEIIEDVRHMELDKAIIAIQDYYNNLTIDHEAGFRKYMSVVLNAEQSKKMRGARRKKTLQKLFKDKAKHLSASERENLANLATVLMGIEAFVVTKDVCDLDNQQSKEVLNWGLKQVLQSVLKS